MAVLRSIGRWKKDDEVAKCDGCTAQFGLLLRRHHCRSCGGIFCNTCTSHSLVIPLIHRTDEQRVCGTCHSRLVAPVPPPRMNQAAAKCPPAEVSPRTSTEPCADASSPPLTQTATEDVRLQPEQTTRSQSSMDSEDFDGPVDITSKIASGAMISSHYIPSTGNLSFLSALQDGLKQRDADNVLSVLIFVSPLKQQPMMVTFEPHETMGDLAARLAEFYFKLENPPFRKMTGKCLDTLLLRLRFTSEFQAIQPSTEAASVAMQFRNVVLSTQEALQQSVNTTSERSLKEFWRSERSDQLQDESLTAGW